MNIDDVKNYIGDFSNYTSDVKPRRDWTILVGLLFVMFLGTMSFDAFLYYKNVGGDMYVSVDQKDMYVQKIKVANLDSVILNFENKKITTTNLKRTSLIDPSL
jgi:hypothetical protein